MRKAREPMPAKMIEKPANKLCPPIGRGVLRAAMIAVSFIGTLVVA